MLNKSVIYIGTEEVTNKISQSHTFTSEDSDQFSYLDCMQASDPQWYLGTFVYSFGKAAILEILGENPETYLGYLNSENKFVMKRIFAFQEVEA